MKNEMIGGFWVKSSNQWNEWSNLCGEHEARYAVLFRLRAIRRLKWAIQHKELV